MDNDSAAQLAYEQSQKDNLIDNNDVIFANVTGKQESEFEDLLKVSFYSDIIPTTLKDWQKYINNKNKKWSDNIKSLYTRSGTVLDLEKLKYQISEKVAKNPLTALDDSKSSTLEALIGRLETVLNNKD